MTTGETRVRTQFNPSSNGVVDDIKMKSAELINLCESLKRDAMAPNAEESNRLAAIAMTKFEEAAMWAVKAATTP